MIVGLREQSGAIRGYYHKVKSGEEPPYMRKKRICEASDGIRMIVGLREQSGAIRGYYHKVKREEEPPYMRKKRFCQANRQNPVSFQYLSTKISLNFKKV